MALADAYITAAELKSQAHITDTADDTEITAVTLAVSRSIERYCSRQFNDAGSATARTYATSYSDCVRVDDFHTVTGLVVKSDTGLDGNYATTISSSNYDVWPFNGVIDGQPGHPYREIRLHTGATFLTGGRPTVQVTAQWGFAAVPADVKQAALIQGARVFGRRYSHNGIVGAGDFAFRVSNQLDPDVQELLRHYRLGVEVA